MKKFRQLIDGLGLDYHREKHKLILENILVLVIGIAVIIVLKKPIMLFFVFCFLLLLNYYELSRYQKELDRLGYLREKEFIAAFGIFQIFVSNNFNVYQALRETSSYSSPWLKERFEVLLKDIDEDKSISPYIRFAHQFKPLIIEQVMTSVYQMVDAGGDPKHLNQFSILFRYFSIEHRRDETNKRENRFDSLNLMPLLGAGLLAIDIVVGVVQIIGGFINGL